MRTLLTPAIIILLCYGITVWSGTPVHWLLYITAAYLVGGFVWRVIYAFISVGPTPSKELRKIQRSNELKHIDRT